MNSQQQHLYRVYKVRSVKSYPEARNHLIIGWMIEENDRYLHMRGRSVHFGKHVNSARDVRMGPVGERIIPWNRIEIINVLPSEFNVEEARLTDDENVILLNDTGGSCPIVNSFERSF